MGLSEIQRGLARLYTDAALRERFFADPLAAGRELGLDAAAARQLADTPAEQIRIFADSLLGKRLQEVARLLPLTQQVLGPRFNGLFRDYAATRLPQGVKKHLDDALSFAAHLADLSGAGQLAPVWLAELARYEKLRLSTSQPGRMLLVGRFRYDITEFARHPLRSADTSAPGKRANLILWFYLSRRCGWRQRVLYLGKGSRVRQEQTVGDN